MNEIELRKIIRNIITETIKNTSQSEVGHSPDLIEKEFEDEKKKSWETFLITDELADEAFEDYLTDI